MTGPARLAAALIALAPGGFAWAGPAVEGARRQPLNLTAIVMFMAFVCITLGITWWAANRTKTANDFFTAGGGISGFQNGLAVAGDYMSAATLLGVVSLVYSKGYDGLLYVVGFFVGWPVMLFLMAERLRNLGKFTFVDIIAYRLDPVSTRWMAATSSLTVVFFYLIVQMVGAGELVQLLFGIDYSYAVVGVGLLMIVYVTFGGMIATTWVQIIKAVLLMFGGTLLTVLALAHFDFSFERLAARAVAVHHGGSMLLGPGRLFADPVSAVSLSLATVFGLSGLPHVLMRFFTVPNAREARKSVFVASTCIGYMFVAMFVIGLASIVIVGTDPQFFEGGRAGGTLLGGGNMVAMHLARATGGDLFLGFLAAVTFATILAVVSGLALAGASAVSHDIYANVLCKGRASGDAEVRVTKWTTLAIGAIAVALGIVFKGQNLAFLVALAFNVAASANFPPLVLSMYWKGLTSRGAVWGGFAGLVSSVGLVILSPAVWKAVLGHPAAIFPYDHPALFTMPLAFLVSIVVSSRDRSRAANDERHAFDAQFVRAQTGLGAEQAARH
ncbi:cation/acetate symporter ActP [Burkholderia stagnalis]|uniref:cation/acetate symporter ActP n=1 Tax=Burkholderia stagnalis TaxID=1503054 RepID=UPI002AB413E6|nr:cation/acetate symporter ActP [Burkholderia stagnalis]MDY7801747.1 cation/acetate symporter ActP [Burkholderia stagnalis]